MYLWGIPSKPNIMQSVDINTTAGFLFPARWFDVAVKSFMATCKSMKIHQWQTVTRKEA